jgi:hypothetical protein
MSRYYYLDIKTPLFKSNIDPFKFPKERHTRLDLETLNPEIVDLFSSLDLNIILIEVFYSRPLFISGIHIDSAGGDINKINWIYGGKNCVMNWYSTKSNDIKEITKTPINTSYQLFKRSEVTLEETTVLRSPSIVDVGVPHNVCNPFEDRWCVSLVYENKDTNIRPSMTETLRLFSAYLQNKNIID